MDSSSRELTREHHQALATILDPVVRREWAEAAEASSWSVQDLREALREASALAKPRLSEQEREKLLAEIRRATADREEADRYWRQLIRLGAEVLTLREVAEAAGVSHTHVRRIRKGPDPGGESQHLPGPSTSSA